MTTALWFSLAAALALTAVELGRSVPAWLRVRRLRTVAGISPIATGVLAGSATGWIAVAVLTASWPALVATIVWLVFHLLLCWELREVNRPVYIQVLRAALITQAAVIIVGVVGVLVGYPSEVLGAAIGAATVAHSLPALITGMTSVSTAGLSVSALLVNSLEGAAYTVGGLGWGGVAPAGEVVLGYILSGGALLIANVPRLARVTYRRVRQLDTPPLIDLPA